MNFGAPPPGVPQVSFDVGGNPASAGGNGEWGWAQTGLAVAGGVLSMTVLGYIISGGKPSKEIRAEQKRLRQLKKQQQIQAMQAMMGGRGPPGPPGQADAMDGLFEAEAQARNVQQQQQQQRDRRAAMREQEEAQQMLQMVLMRCDQLTTMGQHEEAADLYVKAITMLPEALPDYMEVCVELVRMAVNALLEAGKPQRALEVLLSLKDFVEAHPKPSVHVVFNTILAKTMARLKKPEALDLYVLNVHSAAETFGPTSPEYTSQLSTRASSLLPLLTFGSSYFLFPCHAGLSSPRWADGVQSTWPRTSSSRTSTPTLSSCSRMPFPSCCPTTRALSLVRSMRRTSTSSAATSSKVRPSPPLS